MAFHSPDLPFPVHGRVISNLTHVGFDTILPAICQGKDALPVKKLIVFAETAPSPEEAASDIVCQNMTIGVKGLTEWKLPAEKILCNVRVNKMKSHGLQGTDGEGIKTKDKTSFRKH
jgi:hypothetical protein